MSKHNKKDFIFKIILLYASFLEKDSGKRRTRTFNKEILNKLLLVNKSIHNFLSPTLPFELPCQMFFISYINYYSTFSLYVNHYFSFSLFLFCSFSITWGKIELVLNRPSLMEHNHYITFPHFVNTIFQVSLQDGFHRPKSYRLNASFHAR